jgi:hypothetical protein
MTPLLIRIIDKTHADLSTLAAIMPLTSSAEKAEHIIRKFFDD